jgi:hypothetical protein
LVTPSHPLPCSNMVTRSMGCASPLSARAPSAAASTGKLMMLRQSFIEPHVSRTMNERYPSVSIYRISSCVRSVSVCTCLSTVKNGRLPPQQRVRTNQHGAPFAPGEACWLNKSFHAPKGLSAWFDRPCSLPMQRCSRALEHSELATLDVKVQVAELLALPRAVHQLVDAAQPWTRPRTES